MAFNLTLFVLGLYTTLESISAAADMHKGDRLCRFLKFLLSACAGLYSMTESMAMHGTWQLLMMQSAIALGVWPRMVYRIFGGQRN